MLFKYPHLLTGVGRDDNVKAMENIVCLMYGIEEKGVKYIDMSGIVFLWKQNVT